MARLRGAAGDGGIEVLGRKLEQGLLLTSSEMARLRAAKSAGDGSGGGDDRRAQQLTSYARVPRFVDERSVATAKSLADGIFADVLGGAATSAATAKAVTSDIFANVLAGAVGQPAAAG
jgi:hypothetical protein